MDGVASHTRERATFWTGCNLLRHGEVIRISAKLLECVGIDVNIVGGINYCCGATKDGHLVASEGMGRRTSNKLAVVGNEKVITWCPSCHIQLDDVMSKANSLQFDYAHTASILHARRELLAPFLVRQVPRTAILHKHTGFERRVPVNTYVTELLAIVPGYQIIDDELGLAPGHMCSALTAIPAALKDVLEGVSTEAVRLQADDVVTIFHSCHREFVSLERKHSFRVVNYVHVLAEAMGLGYVDEYKVWRNAEDPESVIGSRRIEAAGKDIFERTMLPELKKEPL